MATELETIAGTDIAFAEADNCVTFTWSGGAGSFSGLWAGLSEARELALEGITEALRGVLTARTAQFSAGYPNKGDTVTLTVLGTEHTFRVIDRDTDPVDAAIDLICAEEVA